MVGLEESEQLDPCECVCVFPCLGAMLPSLTTHSRVSEHLLFCNSKYKCNGVYCSPTSLCVVHYSMQCLKGVTLPAVKNMSYISLFSVSGHGLMSDLIHMCVCVCMRVCVCVCVCV